MTTDERVREIRARAEKALSENPISLDDIAGKVEAGRKLAREDVPFLLSELEKALELVRNLNDATVRLNYDPWFHLQREIEALKRWAGMPDAKTEAELDVADEKKQKAREKKLRGE